MAGCISAIAGNIKLDCENPIENGYTGRAVLIPLDSVTPTYTVDAQNPRIISAIALASGDKVVEIDNVAPAPFDGSSTTGNNDAGFVKYTKALAIRMPQRGADFAAKVVEPLTESARGFVAIIEKVDQNGDGSFEIIGYKSPLKVVDPSTVTRSETANGGAWLATLQTSEKFAECVLFDTDYATTLSAFEALLAKAF